MIVRNGSDSLQIAVRNQLNAFLGKHGARDGQSQDAKFFLPGLAQASAGGLQIGIVETRMADKFPCTLGNAAGDGMEQGFVKCSRHFNAQGTVGGEEALAVHSLAKLARKTVQNADFRPSRPEVWPRQKSAGAQREPWPKRVAHSAHAAGRRGAEQGLKNLWKKMSVLVRVKV